MGIWKIAPGKIAPGESPLENLPWRKITPRIIAAGGKSPKEEYRPWSFPSMYQIVYLEPLRKTITKDHHKDQES